LFGFGRLSFCGSIRIACGVKDLGYAIQGSRLLLAVVAAAGVRERERLLRSA